MRRRGADALGPVVPAPVAVERWEACCDEARCGRRLTAARSCAACPLQEWVFKAQTIPESDTVRATEIVPCASPTGGNSTFPQPRLLKNWPAPPSGEEP